MISSTNQGRPTPPVNNGWKGLRLGPTDPAARHTVATPPPAVAKASPPESIPYARRAFPLGEGSRPGILTALGVISIIVGAVTLLINCGLGAVCGYGYMMASDRQTSEAEPAAPSLLAT